MSANLPLGTMIAEPWADYGLIDSGAGRKLERYGPYRFIRPEPQAMWLPAQPDWQAHGSFIPASDEDGGGRWHFDKPVPDGWQLRWEEARFQASCTPFRHLGFFPDMAPVWQWARERLHGLEAPQFLNLFGYTGVGTLALSATGAQCVHVDASKKSVAQARANAALSGMEANPVRWIIDDAAKFAAREVRRERPNMAAARMARSGGWRRTCPASSPIAAACWMARAASCSSPSMPCACQYWPLANCSAHIWAICPAASNAASWRCGRRRGGCCSLPRSGRAGRGTERPQSGGSLRPPSQPMANASAMPIPMPAPILSIAAPIATPMAMPTPREMPRVFVMG